MKNFIIIFCFTFILSCSKPKTVLLCGDHICINNKEAEQYFEENLSLEVKVIDTPKSEKFDLVELNLKKIDNDKKIVTLKKKKKPQKKLKSLSKKEIRDIKSKIKEKDIKQKKQVKNISKDLKFKEKKKEKKLISETKQSKESKKSSDELVDVCTILEKCSIEEISNYLIKEGKKKKYPNVSVRQ